MAAKVFIEFRTESNVVINRHWERSRFLEYHADLGTECVEILLFVENIFTIQQNFSRRFLFRIELIHAVEGAQHGGLAAARGTDKSGHHFFRNSKVDVLEGALSPVVKIQVAYD